jgi:hypothetical protein
MMAAGCAGALALAIEGWRIGRLPAELDTVLSHGR